MTFFQYKLADELILFQGHRWRSSWETSGPRPPWDDAGGTGNRDHRGILRRWREKRIASSIPAQGNCHFWLNICIQLEIEDSGAVGRRVAGRWDYPSLDFSSLRHFLMTIEIETDDFETIDCFRGSLAETMHFKSVPCSISFSEKQNGLCKR